MSSYTAVEEHMTSLNDMLTGLSNSSHYTVKHKYHIGNFRGYSVRMDDKWEETCSIKIILV